MSVAELLAQKLRLARQSLIRTPNDLDGVVADIDAALEEWEFTKSQMLLRNDQAFEKWLEQLETEKC